MARNKGKCLIESCERDAEVCDMCMRCYERIRQQMKRGVKWAVHRARTLQMWDEGLQLMVAREKVSIASAHRKKKTKVQLTAKPLKSRRRKVA